MSISRRAVIFAAMATLAIAGCQAAETRGEPAPTDSDTGSDTGTDTGSDTGADSDSDSDSDTDTDVDGGIVDFSYIWVANSADGTLSKVNTLTEVEVARYRTCSITYCDPSRTSVNLAGDMVVTNRSPGSGSTPSSVVKFAATPDRCVDRNENDAIDTSTGPTDVRPWGEDECMIWSTPIPIVGGDPSTATGARATAWDGTEDPDTGAGGHVWVGLCGGGANAMAYKLDGDTGAIVASVELPMSCAYGGAMDGTNGFWIYDTMGRLARVNSNSLSIFQRDVTCGYGITVDGMGRVWTGGSGGTGNCVSRYDINYDQEDWVDVPGAEFLRGIAVGVGLSEGYVWAADTSGRLYKLDEETMDVVTSYVVGAYNMIGVAVDFQGYVWTVSTDGNSTYKFDPITETHITVPIGMGPYTYSDMTGAQLRNVITPE
jgi:hypothetical protein